MNEIVMPNLDERTITLYNNRNTIKINLMDLTDVRYILNGKIVHENKVIEYMSKLDKNDLTYRILSFCLETNGCYKIDDRKEISTCDGNFNSVNKK